MKMTTALVTAALLASHGLAATASAATIIYASRGEFTAAATSPIATETFESFPTPFSTTATLQLSNSAIFASSPILIGETALCIAGQGKCLTTQSPQDTRLFTEFANSTTGFAVDLRGFNPADIINVSVMTGEGLFQTSIISAVSFLGLTNARGITSVTFNNVGRGGGAFSAYTFDNVSTFTGTIVNLPEPTSWALMIVGIGAMGAVLRRQRVRTTVRFA